jgi:hypothetical protein
VKTVLQELMYLAARVVKHARRWHLRSSCHCPACTAFEIVYARLLAT